MDKLIKIIIGVIGGALLYKWVTSTEDEVPKRRIFLSHSWKKGREEYDKFIKKLTRENIEIYNHSIPEEKAFDVKSRSELKSIFRKQMIYCSKVFVLAINGTKKDSFVGMEIELAKELNKKIIAVKPTGQYGIPKFIENSAHRVIGNNIRSIDKILKDEL